MVDLKISLPLYEGPLDLLLDLIRRQKLNIYDIPIAKITGQGEEKPYTVGQMFYEQPGATHEVSRNASATAYWLGVLRL